MAPSLLSLIDLVDNAPQSFDHDPAPFYRLRLLPDPRTHGFIHPDTLAALPFPPCFTISDSNSISSSDPSSPRTVDLSPPPAGVDPAAHATAALQAVVDAAIASPVFPNVASHSEPFLLVGARAPGVTVERFAASLLGIATRGAHMTAYVRHSSSAPSSPQSSSSPTASQSSPTASQSSPASSSSLLRQHRPHDIQGIWVAKRSAHLHTYPGLWDSTVAGGVKAHDSPAQCIHDEALEEASLPATARARIAPAGALTIANINRRGLFHSEILYVYDLDLSPGAAGLQGPTGRDGEGEEREHTDREGQGQGQGQEGDGQGNADETDARQRPGIVPRPNDEEVERFVLMSPEEVTQRMLRGEFKPNVCPVIIDFMVRHAVLTPDNEPDYAEICARLHRRLPVPMRSDL